MNRYDVLFLPSGRRGPIDEGATLRDAAHSLGEGIESICGGKGSCGKCRIHVLDGNEHGIISAFSHLSDLTDIERRYAQDIGLGSNERLACQARIHGNLAVFVPVESRSGEQIVLKSSGNQTINIIPTIHKYFIDIGLHEINSASKPEDKLLVELAEKINIPGIAVDKSVLETISNSTENNDKAITVTVWDNKEVIRIESGHHKDKYGIAIDIGTTTIGMYLCDLTSGDNLATESMMNPQIQFGEDIMTRISYAKSHANGLVELNKCIIDTLNQMIDEVTSQVNLTPDDIEEIVVVGNTVMHHVFLGLDVSGLAVWPFKPEVTQSVNRKARDLGLGILPSANVHVLPIEAGFVGADNVGVLITEEPYFQDQILLIIDIGTNGELVLGNKQRLLSSSCATGPALEGAKIKFGMRAAPGAIDRVRVDPNTFDLRFTVIGSEKWNTELQIENVKARGICGSGIIDAVAELFVAGIIKKDGGFDKTLNTQRLRFDQDGKPEFVIAWASETAINQDITITQKDVRAVQLAKAAISSGARLMLDLLNIDRPDKVILAGAFGTVVDRERALAIGMFPEVDIENIYSIGNAAGDGARIALLNNEKRQEADNVARDVEYIELTTVPGFNEAFISATHFPIRQ